MIMPALSFRHCILSDGQQHYSADPETNRILINLQLWVHAYGVCCCAGGIVLETIPDVALSGAT